MKTSSVVGDLAEAAERFQLRAGRSARNPNLLGRRELLEELIERAEGEELAVIDDADARTEPRRFLHVMGRVNDRHALGVELFHEFEDGVSRLRVDADGRLVAEQKPRTMQNGGDDVEPAAHSAGVGLHFVAATILELRGEQAFLDPLAQERAAQAVEFAEKAEIFLAAQFVIKRERLRDEAKLLALLDSVVTERFAIQENLTRSAGRIPAINDISVVLPAPFGPRRPKNSPASSESETRSSARTSP